MYHVIADPPADAPLSGALRLRRRTSPARSRWLARHGFHAVTLRDAYATGSFGSSFPTHPIVVTFDDGYHSQFATAAPILRGHGWPGVLNLEVRNTERSWGLCPRTRSGC